MALALAEGGAPAASTADSGAQALLASKVAPAALVLEAKVCSGAEGRTAAGRLSTEEAAGFLDVVAHGPVLRSGAAAVPAAPRPPQPGLGRALAAVGAVPLFVVRRQCTMFPLICAAEASRAVAN
uniref:Uncharacterized protein n=1 Tax=Pyrodinium bahamense TaxID=73915 RepID=A0A7S0FDQ0_9DINO|mmetsp:Transcript_2407/g.6857  ORF Transcript_2407/g.6857 Transcript_2407/m.6857 type:complete len:125 (+) Transcript_2407:54-428(+)|eukprot:CAMPEP_0179110572 /NCGR_PEP_ID=MMETSP0796-20121207/51608_1 /TAXON_ID=73915 /ORGANISM="Pyrodinium bahamense, Strain pbaha01" /LENGTH=124 /DNA_ID=CAMNT_0020808705 /DNA_START=54 /DNA_END=428 /DNA_ORIENTATION=-